MHRPTLGIIALVLLLSGVGLLFAPAEGASVWSDALLRVGILMGVLWLAHPDLKGFPGWLLLAGGLLFLAAAFFVVRKPSAVALLAAVVILLVKLRAISLPSRRKGDGKERSPRRTADREGGK
ncbi:MAG: hypothetical protein HYS13_25170 [Planctomycetia bacterium]|nr:hypothetical protein [Planctomycetia bacterium]